MKCLQVKPVMVVLGFAFVIVSACGSPAAPPKAVAPVAVAGSIEVSEPRIRVPASGQDQTAAYLTLTNTSAQSDRLVSAASPKAKKLELHAHSKAADGMMTMRWLAHIEVPPKTTIPLIPGGLHIMVKQVTAGMIVGDSVPVELTFASGAKASFSLPVVANPSALTPSEGPVKQGHQH